MKKFKRTISLLLTFALLMTTAAFTSVTAFGADLTQDFENVTIDELMSAGWEKWGTTNLTITTVGDTKALELNDGTGGVKIPLNVESGKIEISFSVLADSANTDVRIPIELTNGTSSEGLIYFAPTQIQETSGAANKINVPRSNGVWYDVKVTIDDWAAETKTFTTNVYNQGETVSLGSYTDTYAFDNEYLLIRNWGASTTVSNPIYIDNVSVKEDSQPPVEDELPEGTYLDEDFETKSVDTLLTEGWEKSGTTNLTITTVGDTKALELNDGTGGVKIPLNAESGKIEISFSVLADSANTDVRIPIELTNGTSSEGLIYFARTQIQETSSAANKINVPRSNGVWYDVKVTIDDWAAETKTFTTNVYNQGETVSLGSYTDTYAFSNEYLLIRNWGASTTVSNPIYIDNVSVKEVVEVPEFENPVKINEDFEDDTTLADAKADGLKDQANIDKCGKIIDVSGNKAMGLLRSTNTSSGFYYELGEPITSGKVKLTFRVKAAQTNTLPVSVGDSSSIFAKDLFQLVNNKTIVGLKKGENSNSVIASSYPANEWINVDVLMDLDNDVAAITIGDVKFDTDFTLEQLRYVTFRSWWFSSGDDTNYDLFDDIVVQKWVEAPQLYDNGVKLYDLEGAVITAGVVTPAVSKITLDFGTELFEDSLTDAVTLTNTAENTTETLTAANITAQGVCTFETDVLEAETKYILEVSTDVKNILGTAMAEAFEYEFTTDAGIKEVELTTVTKGNSAVSKLSDFTAGASITLNGTYLSFDEAETELAWVIAYFDGDVLKKASVVETSVSGKGLKDITCPATVIADMTDIDKVEIYLWNNMEDIVPYCTGLSY